MDEEIRPPRQRLLDAYLRQLRETGHRPDSVWKFTSDLGLSEREFFENFSSLDVLESEVWRAQIDHVIQSVESGSEWTGFTARQRLLTFLFAWAEHSLDLRSVLLTRFGPLNPLQSPPWLDGFNRRFREFAKSIIAHGRSTGEIAGRGVLTRIYPDAFLTAFRTVIQFHLRDTSPSFERTDAFIEKTTALSFDLLHTQAIDSAFDLARFLVPSRDR